MKITRQVKNKADKINLKRNSAAITNVSKVKEKASPLLTLEKALVKNLKSRKNALGILRLMVQVKLRLSTIQES